MTTLVTSGKTKELYTTENDGVLRAHYTDHTTAGDGLRNELIDNKGAVNNQISSLIFAYLNQNGVATHFIEQVSETDQLNKKVEMIPLEVVVRNFAAGHFQKRFGTDYLQTLKQPVVEFFYKENDLHDPIVTKSDVVGLDLLSAEKLEQLEAAGLKVNQVLTDLFNKMNVTLVDFKLEFGINAEGEIILADEISPDSCRLLDKDTNESLDKDVFRKQTGDLMPGYLEILHRLQKAI
ncbi:phosphoribosylaminoimidazolesuccinocarboxamide synthase [Apilactobacillus apinorum]|uniref:phosphoribosylaminoimidazolesuccinocarboxamide synthase n=1 Tax=Apilactobacillus apinorum TaxID=1218495 RepID=UPI0006C1A199|nr:phosphoribosylaminoimidazolesuccinocarboxamide synthase [Apilactobacillus apinorum]KOY68152.1 Phosphoribosylaminoimidazole-succinocarboxamide synthase [Apilactobacillus apinorum]CAI2692602.1 purCPhosphoribosylaminoimidazole-succinocarboxamidesynthase [Apilactobacillus apinorum]